MLPTFQVIVPPVILAVLDGSCGETRVNAVPSGAGIVTLTLAAGDDV
jgi:hypothetical protein